MPLVPPDNSPDMGYAARCDACGYEWWVIHRDNLPMPLNGAIRLMQTAHCPKCDNDGKHGKPLFMLLRPPKTMMP